MIAVFKTDVHEAVCDSVLQLLRLHFPDSYITIDLEDCDRVLRIDPCHHSEQRVELLMTEQGYYCETLT
jgi:hypothetical protein